MTKQGFWALMDSCRSRDTEIYEEKLLKVLAQVGPDGRLWFDAWVAGYLEAVSGCVWLDMACKVINQKVGGDTSWHFALWVIGQGERTLLSALQNPDVLADLPYIPREEGAGFQALMGLGCGADEDRDASLRASRLERMRQCSAEIAPTIAFRGGDKMGGYESFEAALEDNPPGAAQPGEPCGAAALI